MIGSAEIKHNNYLATYIMSGMWLDVNLSTDMKIMTHV